MDILENDYLISDNHSLLQIKKIFELLNDTYWARNRTIETVTDSVKNSLCFGIYKDNVQIGFARCITDYATTYWLCDVIIENRHRNQGLGKRLIKYIVEHDKLKSLYGILSTRDAHGLYEQYGFERESNGFMHKC